MGLWLVLLAVVAGAVGSLQLGTLLASRQRAGYAQKLLFTNRWYNYLRASLVVVCGWWLVACGWGVAVGWDGVAGLGAAVAAGVVV